MKIKSREICGVCVKKINMQETKSDKVIVILLGRKDSGKGTLAKLITAACPQVVEMALAAHLKKTLCTMFDWDPELLEGVTDKSREWREKADPVWSEILGTPIVPREMMVRFGSQMVRRDISSKFWMAYLHQAIQKSPARVVLISDGRLVEEYQYFLERYKKVIVCSVESQRAVAPYRDELIQYIEKHKKPSPNVEQSHIGEAVVKTIDPYFTGGKPPSLKDIELYLTFMGAFYNNVAELSEWETVLMQITGTQYMGPHTPSHWITIRNDGSKEDLSKNTELQKLLELLN